MKPKSPRNWVLLGKVTRPHGIKGALSLKLDNPESETLQPHIQVQIEKKDGSTGLFEVASFQAGRILQLKDLNDRTAAEKFSGSLVYVSREDLPEIESDEIYLSDMLNFEVYAASGEKLGHIEGFSDNNAQTILEVRSVLGNIGLIPFVKPLILEIDQNAHKIIVDLPEGLFEKD